MAFFYELDLDWVKMNHPDRYLCQRTFLSKVVTWSMIIQTHIHSRPPALHGRWHFINAFLVYLLGGNHLIDLLQLLILSRSL